MEYCTAFNCARCIKFLCPYTNLHGKGGFGNIRTNIITCFLIQHGIFTMRKDIHYYNDFILCFARYHLLLWLFIVQPGIDCGITKQHLKLLG